MSSTPEPESPPECESDAYTCANDEDNQIQRAWVNKRRSRDMGWVAQNLWLFVFRGQPADTWNKRHVLLYLDSPDDPHFHFTCHVTRTAEDDPFQYTEERQEQDYTLDCTYLRGFFLGSVWVAKTDDRSLVDVVASTPVNPYDQGDWNCQHFVYAALQELIRAGFLPAKSVDRIIEQMFDTLLDGAVG